MLLIGLKINTQKYHLLLNSMLNQNIYVMLTVLVSSVMLNTQQFKDYINECHHSTLMNQNKLQLLIETLGFSLENKEVSYFLDDEANCHIDIVTGVASPVLEDKPTQKRKSRTKIEPKQKPNKTNQQKKMLLLMVQKNLYGRQFSDRYY